MKLKSSQKIILGAVAAFLGYQFYSKWKASQPVLTNTLDQTLPTDMFSNLSTVDVSTIAGADFGRMN